MNYLHQIFNDNFLIKGILSKPLSKKGEDKIVIIPLKIKDTLQFQFTIYIQNKALHRNLNAKDAEKALSEYLEHFKEAHFYTVEADLLALRSKSGEWRWIPSKPTKKPEISTHNRLKNYLLDEATNGPFWKTLGIANASGKIKPDKQPKFRQVNRFLEIVSTVMSHLDGKETLNIVDFGCGKAYLTFALYHYLTETLKRKVHITGIDLKKDVVNHLEAIRKDLGYHSLQFFEGDIKTFPIPHKRVDLVISLHACDTATDLVLDRAIQAGAEVILAVPCCQHELYTKIKQPLLNPLLKHGILKERFAALATDALRSLRLEASGYAVQVIEFIDTEHTPKNLMLKAVKSTHKTDTTAYESFYSFLINQ